MKEIDVERERPIIALDGKTAKGSKRDKTDKDTVKATRAVLRIGKWRIIRIGS